MSEPGGDLSAIRLRHAFFGQHFHLVLREHVQITQRTRVISAPTDCPFLGPAHVLRGVYLEATAALRFPGLQEGEVCLDPSSAITAFSYTGF